MADNRTMAQMLQSNHRRYGCSLSTSSPSNNFIIDMQTNTALLEDKMTIKMKQMMNEMKALVVRLRKYVSRVDQGARHFRAKVHYLREVIEFSDIKLEKVHTDDNLADPFTKVRVCLVVEFPRKVFLETQRKQKTCSK
ncbi:hypothetical protein Tco_0268915 [Tanacetum coccineum]